MTKRERNNMKFILWWLVYDLTVNLTRYLNIKYLGRHHPFISSSNSSRAFGELLNLGFMLGLYFWLIK